MSQRDRLGSSGVFKAIVAGARKFKRALSDSDVELPPQTEELGNAVARAFIAGRFADVHALATPGLHQRIALAKFEASWREAVRGRGPFTGFEAQNVGEIDIGFIPGLEDVPQTEFVAFLEIAFSSPEVPLDDEKAFTIGVVMLDQGGVLRVGAIHTR